MELSKGGCWPCEGRWKVANRAIWEVRTTMKRIPKEKMKWTILVREMLVVIKKKVTKWTSIPNRPNVRNRSESIIINLLLKVYLLPKVIQK